MTSGFTSSLSAKTYVETIIFCVQSSLPPESRICWNGNSYTVLSSLNSSEVTTALDRVSRSFWNKDSLVYGSRPSDWSYRISNDVILWPTDPQRDASGEMWPTFLIGEAWYGSTVKEGHSLSKYTFQDKPIVRCDKIGLELQKYLGPSNNVFWNGRGYTIQTKQNVEKGRLLSKFFGSVVQKEHVCPGQRYPLSYNAEKVIYPDGSYYPSLTLYEDEPQPLQKYS
jgi:hypothetical protein